MIMCTLNNAHVLLICHQSVAMAMYKKCGKDHHSCLSMQINGYHTEKEAFSMLYAYQVQCARRNDSCDIHMGHTCHSSVPVPTVLVKQAGYHSKTYLTFCKSPSLRVMSIYTDHRSTLRG